MGDNLVNRLNRKILIITQNFPPETVGGATHNFEMAKYLSYLGCDVKVITTYPTYPYGEFKEVKYDEEDRLYPFNIVRIWTYRPIESDPNNIKRLCQYISFSVNAFFHGIFYNDYKIIITSQPPEFTMLSGFLLKIIFRKTWVVDVRDLWLENAAALGFIKRKGVFYILFDNIRKICLKKADLFAYTAPIIKNWFFDHYSVNGIPIFNPNGIDPMEYRVNSGIGEHIIYIGNVGHAYDLECVMVALKMLSDKKIKLFIRGGGDKKQNLISFAKTNQIIDRVFFIEKLPRDSLLSLISNCRIGICPLKEEQSLESVIPTKVIEYMGCGIPFIGTGYGEIVRLADESKAGIITKNNPECIASEIESLYFNEQKCKTMGNNGRIYVEREFNKIKIINQLLSAIDNVKGN